MKPSLITSACRSNYTIIYGLILFTLGISLTFSKTWLLKIVLPEFILKPNSVIEEFWRKPPIKIPTNVYLFNWTNPEDLYNASINPKFQQLGPYRFLQNMEKVNVIWNDNNTVTYNQLRIWHFDEDYPSNGNLSDTITQINFIAMCVAHKVRYWSYFTKAAVSSLMSSMSSAMHVTKPAKEILFESHDSSLIEIIKTFSFLVPELPKFKEFGLINFRNASSDFEGVINLSNGANGNFEIFNWNYFNETSAFEGQCGEVRGSLGELQSPIQNKDNLAIFYPDICRTLVMDYEEDVVVDGILGYKYSLGNKVFDNGTLIPENECYCIDECTPFGVLNVSSCRYGLPLYASLPNFYQANLADLNLDGLHPEKSKHETYIIVEPKTGIPLKAVVRIQFSTLLHSIDDFGVFEDVPKIYFPLIWAEMEIRLPDQLAPLLSMYLNVPVIYSGAAYVLMTAGVCILAVALVFRIQYTLSVCNTFDKRDQSEPIKPEEVPLQSDTKTFY